MRHLSTGQSPSLHEMRAALPVFGPILKGSWVVNKGSFKGSFKGIYRDSIRVYHNTAFLVASHPGPPPPPGTQNPESGPRTLDPGPGTRNPGHGNPHPDSEPGFRVWGGPGPRPETRNPGPRTRHLAPGTRNQEPGTGKHPGPGTGKTRAGTRDPGPGTRNPGPGPLRARKTISPGIWFMGSYRWGYKSPIMGYKYGCPTYNPTYNYP